MHTAGLCDFERASRGHDSAVVRDPRTAILAVSGMGCPACAHRVHNALALTAGVLAVDVSLEKRLARVIFDAARIDGEDLIEAVAAAGSDGRHNYRGIVIAGPKL